MDAQLPKRLSDYLNEIGFDSLHTLDLENRNRTCVLQNALLRLVRHGVTCFK